MKTTPYHDQKPGTSGLRKRVKVFQQLNYTHNFIQAILSAIPGGPQGSNLVVGGDGRYFSADAIQIIATLAAGNGVRKLYVAKDGILSTPAASNFIRKCKATGGILLTASHNPGGPDADFGIKYNMSNGGPAPESVTDAIFDIASSLTEYKSIRIPAIDLTAVAEFSPIDGFTVQVFDGVEDYVTLMKEIYDFGAIKTFLNKNPSFTVLFDAMHAGIPY
jgi:phosphoglucomutase